MDAGLGSATISPSAPAAEDTEGLLAGNLQREQKQEVEREAEARHQTESQEAGGVQLRKRASRLAPNALGKKAEAAAKKVISNGRSWSLVLPGRDKLKYGAAYTLGMLSTYMLSSSASRPDDDGNCYGPGWTKLVVTTTIGTATALGILGMAFVAKVAQKKD